MNDRSVAAPLRCGRSGLLFRGADVKLTSAGIAADVLRFLAEGKFSRRKIAVLLRISRGTVLNIERRPEKYLNQASVSPLAEQPAGPAVRCGGCGAMTVLPCLACRDRARLASARRSPGREIVEPDSLNLKLHDNARDRYEQIHRQREAEDLNQALGSWEPPANVA